MYVKKLFFICLVFSVVFLSGCLSEENTQDKSCLKLGGYSCTENEQCFGKILDSSDVPMCCSVVCSQKMESENQLKTCSEQDGYICNSGEKCEESILEAKDTTACCSITCTKIEIQPKEKTLEEINLTIDDFPEGFYLNDVVSGYQKNALDYSDGNSAHANEILSNGWQENYKVDFVKRSENQEIYGTKIILEEYQFSLSRYDKAKDYSVFFKKSIKEKKELLLSKGFVILSQDFGDNSVFAKYTESNEYTGLTTIAYYLLFTKDNVFVNFISAGQSRQITDEKVIEYARKLENKFD